MGALDGFKIVDLSRLLPGPFCTTLLADHGAEVIAVEAPHFRDNPVLGFIPMVRRNKRHMALDLRGAEGRDVFFRLVENADVVLEGFRPGVTKRLGVDYETVRARNHRIVYCSITGYGQTGPLAHRAGHDLNYMAAAGMLDLARDKSNMPVTPGFQMADLAGSLYAALGVLLALLSREQTGVGQYIDVSMTDSLVSLLPLPLSFEFSGMGLPGKASNDKGVWFPCYRVYETGDARHISVGPLEPHLWASLCNKLGCPEYVSTQYDDNRREEMDGRLEQIFRSKTLAEWITFLDHPDDCIAPVTQVKELANDPHFKERGSIVNFDDGVPQPGITPKMSVTQGEFTRPPYRFGAHTKEVMTELGYGADEIADLEARGIVWCRP
ncbi:MAG: CaiB/BaiF CoA-transferase family protein [Pseudomonadota bacterium]